MNDEIEEFFKKEYNSLVKRVTFRIRNVDDAEDIVMDAFRRAIEYYDSFDPERREFGAWFNTILNNSIRTFQKEKFMRHIEVEEDADAPIDENYDDKELAAKIKEEIANEKNNDIIDVLNMFLVLGHTYKDIELVTNISIRNARYYVDEFKQRMKEKYGEDMCWGYRG